MVRWEGCLCGPMPRQPFPLVQNRVYLGGGRERERERGREREKEREREREERREKRERGEER